MFIESLKQSVLRCLCHPCQKPLYYSSSGSYHILRKPKCKPKKLPKKVMLVATEIRCTEEAKGGLKYDVILAEAATDPPPKRASSPIKNVSGDEILEKLKAAEERRLSVEASKRSSLNSRFEKLELTLKKKDEEELKKTKEQKEKLDKKLELHNEKREAYLNEIKSKLKDHDQKVEMVRQKKCKSPSVNDKPITE